jgi:alkyl sulfatase BDS1-like metallo-beta-lactamase superfamily hydrolase
MNTAHSNKVQFMHNKATLFYSALMLTMLEPAFAEVPTSKPATALTQQRHMQALEHLPTNFSQGYEDATRGFIGAFPSSQIKQPDGTIIWDNQQFSFIHGKAPDTVNPSLWEQEKLNNLHGLFKVTEGIYQIRGYDLANLTLVEGKTGWIVIDTMVTEELAAQTLAFAKSLLNSDKPISAVIYTHSHVDHFGGVRGVLPDYNQQHSAVDIIAPSGFMEHAIAENVLAGNAMTRRATYQFGHGLGYGPRSGVGSGLGKGISRGTIGLIAPTVTIAKTGDKLLVDGIEIEFQLTNNSEAPAEMMFYFPQFKALCLAEVVTRHMHNVYTIRGAQARNALLWSKFINEAIDLFPAAEVAFGSHHWPVWGQQNIKQFLVNQRDTYRFIHDRALHLANKGATMNEIGAADFFPQQLAADSNSRGYYGSLSHNMRGTYNYYLGYYDGNPSNLNPLTNSQRAARYIELFGGAEALLAAAKKAYEKGDYQWAVELLNHVVFAQPEHLSARQLQADAFEQLAYQAEAATWRNAYLVAAQELRHGPITAITTTQGPDVLQGMSIELILDYLALRLNHQKTDGLAVKINLQFTDLDQQWALELSNSVLNNRQGRLLTDADLTLRWTRGQFLALVLGQVSFQELLKSQAIEVEGDVTALAKIFAHIETFDPTFNIVTP